MNSRSKPVRCLTFYSVLGHNPNDLDTKMKLAHAYEDFGNPVRALELVNEGKCPQLERTFKLLILPFQ
jgi:hypothetical protein